jgi:hypothetical protein
VRFGTSQVWYFGQQVRRARRSAGWTLREFGQRIGYDAGQHVCGDGAETIGVTLARAWNPPAVTIVVSDSSPDGPRRCATPVDGEQGWGLQIVEALSAHWGWHPQDGGKAVFAVLA